MIHTNLARYLVATYLLLGACGGSSDTNPAQLPASTPPPVAGTFGDGGLDALVEWSRALHGIPALGVVIVVDGQVVETSAQGLRSATGTERVTTGDRWHIGSLTKGLTSALAAVLVELSVLRWDTRPLDVWPELGATMHPQFRNITLQQLLSHTAGIRAVGTVPSRYSDLAAGTLVDKRRAFAAELLAEAPANAIGKESYSNGGYIVAGAMMETLMTAPWETLLSDYVFAPLDMRDSGFGAPGVPGELSQPRGHWDQGADFQPVRPGPDDDNPQVFGPAGTVHTTMRDYANFMLAHLDGTRGIDGFVSAASFDTLHTAVDGGSALGWGVASSAAWPGEIELVHAGGNQRWYAIVRLVPHLNGGALFVTNAGGDLSAAAIDALDDLLVERFKNSR